MRRTMIIGAISVTALTIGLGVGASLANADPSPTTPTTPTDMTTMMRTENGRHMPDATDMTSMMNGNGMSDMMDADGMASMHAGMHEQLDGIVPADVLAACDAAHSSLNGAGMPPTTDVESGHTAHHPGTRP